MTLDELVAKAVVARIGSTSLAEFFPPGFDDSKLDELERAMNEGMARAAQLLVTFSTVLEAIEQRRNRGKKAQRSRARRARTHRASRRR